MSNFEFTDKAQQSVASAIQLAKDYANAQGMSYTPIHDLLQSNHNRSSSCSLGSSPLK